MHWHCGSISSSPRVSRDHIVGAYGDEIKVVITSPPVDSQANNLSIHFLTKGFRVAESRVIMEKRELGCHKQLKIDQPRQIPEFIVRLLGAA
ncbi:DUF167 family protein [Sodalis-like endosymbiont of Proechinophthirus fluctus]|uniref:DUF167 family protein n=1 Tax=Sodalis-like endosymbiont of Proechinophthirus fluctus TaxID=1462730 RepID=UPI000A88B050